MAKYSVILIMSFLFSCETRKKEKAPLISNKDSIATQISSILCLEEFEKFRKTIITKDKSRVKSYFNFPLDGDDLLWHLVLDSIQYEQKGGKFANTFTESDFDNYYHSLFPDYLISGFTKLNAEELFAEGETETQEYLINNVRYRLTASKDSFENVLTINLSSECDVEVGRDEIHKMKSNLIYYFSLSKGCGLKFLNLMIAG